GAAGWRGQPHSVLPPNLYMGPSGRGTFQFRAHMRARLPKAAAAASHAVVRDSNLVHAPSPLLLLALICSIRSLATVLASRASLSSSAGGLSVAVSRVMAPSAVRISKATVLKLSARAARMNAVAWRDDKGSFHVRRRGISYFLRKKSSFHCWKSKNHCSSASKWSACLSSFSAHLCSDDSSGSARISLKTSKARATVRCSFKSASSASSTRQFRITTASTSSRTALISLRFIIYPPAHCDSGSSRRAFVAVNG